MSMLRFRGAMGVLVATATFGFAWGCTNTVAGPTADEDAGDAAAAGDAGPATKDAGRADVAVPETPVVQVPSGTTSTLRAVWSANDTSLAVAVGEQGTIVLSIDQGKTWSPSTSGVTTDLSAVWGSSPGDVWIGGKAGTVLHSTDGAKSWSATTVGKPTELVGVWGASADQVFFAGVNGAVFRTLDKGVSFPSDAVASVTPLVGVSGTSATEIWTASSYNLFRSSNGGEAFSTVAMTSLGTQRAIWAGSAADVYTVNEGSIVTRWDGAVIHKHTPLGGILNGVWGSSTADVYVVGEQGLLRHSTDRSSTWRKVAGASGDLHGVHGSKDVLLVVGTGGAIFRR